MDIAENSVCVNVFIRFDLFDIKLLNDWMVYELCLTN